MGQLVFAAKITHVPSMFVSEREGPHKGCRKPAIDGLKAIGERINALGAETVLMLDTHWLVNSGYHVNAGAEFSGLFTSNEFPHFVQDLPYAFKGDPEMARLIAQIATQKGVHTRAHDVKSLDVEYGTLVPLHYLHLKPEIGVVSVAAWPVAADLEESRVFGEALLAAIEASDKKVAILASGSLSHRIADNTVVEAHAFEIADEFFRQADLRALELWRTGQFKTFVAMLPSYAKLCYGEGMMHDTAMLLGALGWDGYDKKVEIVTDYFPSSGTGQVNAIFPV